MPDIENYSRSDFEKAKESCRNAKNDIREHFAAASKMIVIGNEAKRSIERLFIIFWYEKTTECTEDTENYYNSVISASSVVDYPYTSHLSEEIKKSQIFNEYLSDRKKFKSIGIDNPEDYAIFQNKGGSCSLQDEGSFSCHLLRKKSSERNADCADDADARGYDIRENPRNPRHPCSIYIHKIKELDKNQKILDHMGSTKSAMNLRCVDEHEKSNELVRTKTNSGGVSSYRVRCVRCQFFSYQLAANLFRATQTDDKLRRENIREKENANNTHFVVGKKVRQTIKELGGTMPEDLELPEKSIQEIEEKPKKRLLQGELE